MKGKHKKFEPALYALFDEPAKQAIAVHLRLQWHDVIIPPEDYGPDLYSVKGTRKMYHEAEVSRLWPPENMFSYATGSIPARKARLLTKIGGCELYFWMLRVDLKRALVYSAGVALDERWLVEVPNKNIESGEFFYRPPVKLGKEFDLASI